MTTTIFEHTATALFPQLGHYHQMPKKLYTLGEIPNTPTRIAIVGSRNMTDYGKQITRDIVRGLSGYQVAIVSGLAFGIDSCAHQACLDFGVPTIAIPGSGLAPGVIAPREHESLAYDIVAHGGALLSPFEPKCQSAPWTFPHRNRLIAGISHMVIVIEARAKSGSLITAEFANEFGITVGAVPGDITRGNSEGTNALLRQGATLIRGAHDIISDFGWDTAKNQETSKKIELTALEAKILAEIANPKTINEVARALGLPLHEVSATITLMELRSLIRNENGTLLRRQ